MGLLIELVIAWVTLPSLLLKRRYFLNCSLFDLFHDTIEEYCMGIKEIKSIGIEHVD